MVSIPDLLLVKILDLFNLYKVLHNPYLSSGAGIILTVNMIIGSAKAKRLNGSSLLFRATDNAAHLGNP
jgi:hypothetical protein